MLDYILTEHARSQYDRAPAAQRERILDLICWVCENPAKHHSGPIDEEGQFFTADRDAWRVIFTLAEGKITVVVVAVITSPPG